MSLAGLGRRGRVGLCSEARGGVVERALFFCTANNYIGKKYKFIPILPIFIYLINNFLVYKIFLPQRKFVSKQK